MVNNYERLIALNIVMIWTKHSSLKMLLLKQMLHETNEAKKFEKC